MTLTAAETLAKSAGDVYTAPLATGVPTDLDTLDPAWVHMGWLHEDGPSLSGFAPENTKRKGWNRQAPVRSLNRFGEPTVEVPLLQWNAENLQLYFPGATHDVPTSTLSIPDVGNPTEQELLIVVQDGADKIGLWVARTAPRGGDDISFPEDDLAPIPVVFDVLSPASGALAAVVGVDVAA